MEAINLSALLSELDEKVLPDGSQKTFSIKFVKKNGELVYYPRCVSTGLNLNLKANAMRGLRLVDRNFDPMDHHDVSFRFYELLIGRLADNTNESGDSRELMYL